MKKKILLGTVAILIMLNGWRWISGSATTDTNQQHDASNRLDLALVSTLYEKLEGRAVNRDIFDYKSNVLETMPLVIKETKSKTIQNSKNNLSRKKAATASSRSKLKLAGVLINKSKKHAFILSNGKERALAEGDILNGAYRVSAITALSVKLYNLSTKHVLILNL